MALDKADVAHIARLARIRVADEDLSRIAGDLNHIIGWVEQLREVDTETAVPMTSVVATVLKMREDAVTAGGYPDKVLANAPERADHFYAVPKVVE